MKFILGIILFASTGAMAAVEGGIGLSSVTSGRHVPALTAGFSIDKWAMSGSSTGVANYYYYHSAYTLNGYYLIESGDLWWGRVESGLGVGILYQVRGFKDDNSSSGTESKEYKHEDGGFGPAFRVRWFFGGPVYANLEMIWGLRGGANLLLNGQDAIVFSIGLQSW